VGKDIDKAEAHPDFNNMFIALTRWDLAKKEDADKLEIPAPKMVTFLFIN
jgi:hypothetical protein